MNQQELIQKLSTKLRMTKTDVEKVIVGFKEEVQHQLSKRGTVKLIGLGTFTTKAMRERKGRNPQTGEIIQIAASVKPKFIPGQELKDLTWKKKSIPKQTMTDLYRQKREQQGIEL